MVFLPVKRLIQAVLAVFCFSGLAFAQQTASEKLELDYFFAPTCHVCHEVREKTISQIENRYSGKLRVNFRDISALENYKLLMGLREKCGLIQGAVVPAAQFSGKLFSGKGEISGKLEKSIEEVLAGGTVQKSQNTCIDLVSRFFTFTPVAVVSAGLIDGINPCAFTVIVFFISFLALQ